MNALQRSAFLLACLPALSLQGQFMQTHQVDISVGATGEFSTILTANPATVSATAPFSPVGTYAVTVSNVRQDTTTSAGLLASLQFHPFAWAGVEMNYGFTQYSEVFTFNYPNTSTPTATQRVQVPTDNHEFTAAYLLHPHRIPLQPFFGIGGGAIDFDPGPYAPPAPYQWRAAGLLEAGFDVPLKSKHVGIRVEGRSLYYRSPNFSQASIGTHSWRVTAEPALSLYYRF